MPPVKISARLELDENISFLDGHDLTTLISNILNRNGVIEIDRTIGENLTRKAHTSGYIFFYILFLPDSWQILIGIMAAYFLLPVIVAPDMGMGAKAMLYIMLAVIGYAGSRIPARGITRVLKKWILGDRIP